MTALSAPPPGSAFGEIATIFELPRLLLRWPDPWTPDVEHVEVGSTHIGLGIDPDVYRIVAQRLAQPRVREAAASVDFPRRANCWI